MEQIDKLKQEHAQKVQMEQEVAKYKSTYDSLTAANEKLTKDSEQIRTFYKQEMALR